MFDVGDYEQIEDTETEPPRCSLLAKCSATLFIDAEPGVRVKESGDENNDKVNEELNKFMVADDVEF